jgi:hypothetical protein
MPNLPEFASNVQCFAHRSIVLGSLDKAPPEPGSVVVHGVDPNFLMAPPRNPVRTSTTISRANQAAAFDRISRSSLSCATAALVASFGF